MREIKFRGKRVDNGEWVYGYYFILPSGAPAILNYYMGYEQVAPDTVGQFTGLTDKNGTEIFEGDIVYIKCGYGFSAFVGNGIVFFDEKRLQFRVKSVEPSSLDSEKGNIYDECDFTVIDGYKVIENIYDNPELLEDMK